MISPTQVEECPISISFLSLCGPWQIKNKAAEILWNNASLSAPNFYFINFGLPMTYNKQTTKQIGRYLGTTLVICTFAWAFWPEITTLIHIWSNNEDYSHGFFIVPMVAYLIAVQKPQIDWEKHDQNWLGLIGVVASILLYIIGYLSEVRTLAHFAFILTIWGGLLFLLGFSFTRRFCWELSILIFMLPIPSRLYASITLPLQLGVTKVSFLVLQLFNIPVYREGNILHLANVTLEVVNACSGLRSILTIIVLSFIVSCMYFTKTTHRIVLIILSIPFAMLANLIRVIVIALFAQQGNTNFVHGTGHTILGIALFCFSLVLLILSAKAIKCITSEKQ
ncbi:exosortase/archaeosortase family protein [Desulfopila sp. IMCC35008]|uniref:exosortase/archaeosortase family protein n=1 Tax=Desulfopila sp. IMCC35008 TaxID=2653858 RepID=UPI0013D35383|nr:exosortase/archaeosortase family protein [Desulfopila sp. IMCC35008]